MHRRVALGFFALALAWVSSAEAKSKKKKSAPAPAPAAAPAEESAPAPTAPAAPTPQTLDGAIQLYQNARFAESISVLDKVFRAATDLGVKKQAKLYLGMNFLSLGNEPRAQQMFRDLLDLDPDFELPTFSSPSVRQFYQHVKGEYKIIPVPTHTPPPQLDAPKGADLHFDIQRMRPKYQATLYYRAQGASSFSRIDLSHTSGDAYVGRLPPALLVKDKGYALEYFVVITEGPVRVLAELRSDSNPFVVPVSVPVQMQTGTPVYKKWWLWTIIGGALAIGGGVTTAVVLTSQTPPSGQANVVLKF